MTLQQYCTQYGRPHEKARETVRAIALRRHFGSEEVEEDELAVVELDLDLEELGVRLTTSEGTAIVQYFVYEPGRFDDWLIEHVDLEQGEDEVLGARDIELLLYCGQILLETEAIKTRDGQIKSVTDTFRDELVRILDEAGEEFS